MSDQAKIAKNLERFRIGVNAHDRENETATGIGLSFFDADRLGFDDGEELWAGITVRTIEMSTGNFRVLCDGEHYRDREREAEAEERVEIARAVGVEA